MKSFRKGALSQSDIIQWLRDLRGNPSVPESGFDVTSVFRARCGGDSDYYFGGVNVEISDHRLSTHGEEGSLAGIVTGLGREAEVVEGWIMGAPRGLKPGDASPFSDTLASSCGKCRQQVAGFARPGAPIHSVSLNGNIRTTRVGDCLPDPFTFRQYVAELVDRKETGTAPSPSGAEVEKRLMNKGPLPLPEIRRWMEGLQSVDYASKVSQHLVARLDNGFYVAGTKIEEAAFVSVNAAQSAVALATTEFGERTIEEVWVYTKGRDEKALPSGAYGTLPMSALQTLFQFAVNGRIPVHHLNDGPDIMTLELTEAAKVAPTSKRPFYQPAPRRPPG